MPALIRRLRVLTLGALAITAIACSEATEETANRYATVELDASFPEPFSFLSGVRELPDGRILAADPLGQVLLAIDLATGQADTLGGVGGGPGEYQQPDRVFPLPGDSSLLVDLGNARLTSIAPDLTLGDGIPMAQQSEEGSMLMLIPRFLDARGRIYTQALGFAMGGQRPDSSYVTRYDRATGAVDTVAAVKLPEMEETSTGAGSISIGPRPMTPEDGWAVGPDGSVVVVRASDYSVDWYRPDGSFVDGPPNEVAPLSVTEADKQAWVDQQGADGLSVSMMMSSAGERTIGFSRGGGRSGPAGPPDINDYDFPEVLPVFRENRIRVSPEGFAWVERYMHADSPPTFDIFDPQGVRVGTVQLPQERRLIDFGEGTIYVARIDDVDLRWLERYRIVR